MSLSYARFPEPSEEKWFKRTARYVAENLRIADPRASRIVSDDEYQDAPMIRVTYEIEQLRHGEPEITGISVENFTQSHEWRPCTVTMSTRVEIEDYLRDDHERWVNLCDWLEENAEYDWGEREYEPAD